MKQTLSTRPILWKLVLRGLGRPLKKEKDFKRSMGEEVEIRTYRPINREKEFYGVLTAYDENSVTIDCEGEEKIFKRQISL